jgi:RNA polymerase sigma-70 factor, ECF subfamily
VSLAGETVANLFEDHRSFLWGLCYRLTGDAADADDLVQETFARALTHPPARTDEPWRPWLVRVALNLGRDLLRRRRRRSYVGVWLPSPIDTGEDASPPSHEPTFTDGMSTERRYDLLESVSVAFLVALEVLTPQQRAVLLLRDVFDYSVHETSAALGITEANVKTTHHRARRAMQDYDQARCVPTQTLQERTRQALERLLTCLFTRDITGLEKLLAADVRALSDGGGEFLANLKPVIGREKLLRFYLKTLEHQQTVAGYSIRTLNGLPALVVEFAQQLERRAPRFVQQCLINAQGQITTCYAVLSSRKLTAVRFS